MFIPIPSEGIPRILSHVILPECKMHYITSFSFNFNATSLSDGHLINLFLKLIYSEKATNFREISTVDLSYVVMVK